LDKLFALAEPYYAIYQLKDGEDLRDYRFSNSEYLKNHGMYVDRENYNKVYRGRMKDGETLDDIYRRFNLDHPQDFRGHSLSVSDIVLTKKDGAITANFVDSIGFTEVIDFTLSREERKARRTLTDNLTLIADKQLSSDEMDDLGDKLFNFDNAPKYSGSSHSWIIGAGMTADEFESVTSRYHNGEDVRAELAKKIYDNMSHISFLEYPPTDGISVVDISTEKTDSGMTFRTEGGFEITYSWEALGNALIVAARKEFDRHEELDRQLNLFDEPVERSEPNEPKAEEVKVEAKEKSATYSTNDLPTITCEWSESPVFEEGKTYSVLEFDTLMKQADREWVAKRQQEIDKYGNDFDKIYAAYEKGEIDSVHQGYAKTKFTVNMPDGTTHTERQDIGDGYGGVIDFLSRYGGYKKIAEELQQALNVEKTQQLNKQAEERAQSTTDNGQENFRITDEMEIGEGGLKAKFRNNIAAITTLKTIENEKRTATPDEQQILAKYVGWGGLAQAFDPTKEQWSKEYKQLRELLTDDEYKAAAESTLNAHYTSPEIIEAMYKALENFGYEGGNVLEPAMGVGNFFGCMPDGISKESNLYGVELDSLTGRIAKQLYPQADIRVQGFEKTDFPDNFFDVAVGNVPFGNYGIADRRYDKEHFLVHDYFFAKTLDKVAPGGIVAFVTSKGTLDKTNPKVREYLAKRADLIGAIRLPNNAFKNANTEVTSDIIFLQKREKMAVELPDWCYTAQNADGISVNQYFIDHPDMVLGKLEYTSGAFGQEVTCTPIEGANLSEQLNKAVSKLRAEVAIHKHETKQNKECGIIPANSDVQNFTHTLVDGKMYYRENNIMTEVTQTGKDLERMKGLHSLRLTLREMIDAQTRNCSDEELHSLQEKLNAQYDSFKKEHGNINDRANANVFRHDDDYNTLCALEIVDTEKKTTEKSDIFTQRTIKPTVEITHVDTPQEALQVSMDMKGRVDINFMAELCRQNPDEVVNALVENNQIFLNPAKYNPEQPLEGYEENSEYLSGNVREKLRIAEYAAKENPELFERNVTKLTNSLPPTIAAGDISTRLGASWIDVQDYERFLKEYIGRDFSQIALRRTPVGEYKVENKTLDRSVAATNTYGTERLSAYHIFENLLNHRDVTVKDRIDLGEDKFKYVVNTKETQLANEKARQMNEAFSKWVWATPERRDNYVTRYNELFNSIVGRHYDGSHQSFPGMAPNIQLKPHQKDAVARAKFGGNTLLAHCVGAGKSFEMIAATMEKKRLGLINKACVVVPKALVGQTANEWLRLYPQAKILVAGDKDFTKENRQKFIGRCCTGDYAAVVMSYEQFEKIQMSVEYRQQFLQRELDALQSGISDLNPYLDRTSIKDLQRAQKRIKAKIEKLLDTAKTKDTSLTFEQLGFDSLVVDEAHNYKNGLVVSKMSNVSGVQTTPAQKSEDILMKTQYLNETYGPKNILFATGTPVTNSMTELYTMQRYLRPDLLEKANLQTFDDWAGNFGEVVSQLELKPAGDGFRTKKRFAKFTNLPELMQMYKEFADIRTADMLNLPVPELEGGKTQTIVAKPNEFQRAYMEVLAKRSEEIHNGSIDPTVDNMLKVTNEARLLGLDARAINPDTDNTPDSKVNLCIDKVMEIYERTAEEKGVQAIFCDIAVNSTDGRFSVYDYIKEELVRRGIPESEICTAGDAKNQEKRNEMFAQLRSGQKRIVLASTSRLGTGANIQTRLAALHHLDIPWKPSDLEQRNGRIIRQGNQFDKVSVFNYLTENTFDAYMMNIIVTKQKFISQLMSGKTPARTCEDVDEMVLNYSEMQALATGDPRIKEKIDLDNDVSRLRTLESEHYNNKYKLEDVVRSRTTNLKLMEQRVEIAKADKAFADEQMAKSEEFSVTFNGRYYTDRSEAGEILSREIAQCIVQRKDKELGEYKGFTITISTDASMASSCAELKLKRPDGLTYSTSVVMNNNIGNITRMENVIKNEISKEIASCESKIEQDKADIATASQSLLMPFEHAEELQEKTARLEQLNAELDCGRNEEVFINDENTEEISEEKQQAKTTPPLPTHKR
ncbi:MAG: YodL domain-containing protein, partial [Oscillospiraceae bacterium]